MAKRKRKRKQKPKSNGLSDTIYYKAVNCDMTALRGYRYKLGKIHKKKDTIMICSNGFHFCKKMMNCFNYYPLHARIFKVKVNENNMMTYKDKSVTDKIQLVEEITGWEFYKIIIKQNPQEAIIIWIPISFLMLFSIWLMYKIVASFLL